MEKVLVPSTKISKKVGVPSVEGRKKVHVPYNYTIYSDTASEVQHAMTNGHCHLQLGVWGCCKPLSRSRALVGVQGEKPLEALQPCVI